MENKLLTLLGFASKAGKLSFGFEAVVTALKRGSAKLVLTAEDISPKSCKESVFFAEKYGVKCAVLNGIDIITLTKSVGRKCGIVSVNDIGFATACENTLIEGGNADDK